jgi:hypothetical protein
MLTEHASANSRIARRLSATLLLGGVSTFAPHAACQEAMHVTERRPPRQPPANAALLLRAGDTLTPLDGRARFAADPECGTMKYFGEGMAAGMAALYSAAFRGLDLLVPDIGTVYTKRNALAPALSWPVIIPFGPVSAREITRHHCADDDVVEFQSMRLVPEFGVSFGNETSPWLRLGYGTVLQARGSKFGLLAGIGPTFALRDAHLATLLSPELGLHFGTCCRPLFLTLLARYEHMLFGEAPASILFKLGFSYW